eukprot:TRINITY_DN105569_c0_g1_i1.p1 TRINITY_DN105569_c0_g1~~TRINITY_DN105569_c0_g1_i1.p1  ORF type:complete len:202 (-),score=65.96 TRINITY_DN105569_c0_g1_i1:110-715(-)
MAYSGEVKSFNPHKGYGFIIYNGQDVFLDAKQLRGIFVDKGMQVNFNLITNAKGQPQAQDISLAVIDPDTTKYLGEIKSFNPMKGFGFITSDAFPEQDIFVVHSELPSGMGPKGARCKFKVEMNEKGANAKDVWLLGHHADEVQARKQLADNPMAMMMSVLTGGMKGKGKGKGGGGCGGGGDGAWNPMFTGKGKGKMKGKF